MAAEAVRKHMPSDYPLTSERRTAGGPPVAVLHLVAQRRLSKELHVRSRAFCVLRKLKDHEQSAQIVHLDIQGTKGETLEGTLGVI